MFLGLWWAIFQEITGLLGKCWSKMETHTAVSHLSTHLGPQCKSSRLLTSRWALSAPDSWFSPLHSVASGNSSPSFPDVSPWVPSWSEGSTLGAAAEPTLALTSPVGSVGGLLPWLPCSISKGLLFCSTVECKRLSRSPLKKWKFQRLCSPFSFQEHSEKREGLPLFSPGKSNLELCKNASKKRTFLPINGHLMNKRETIEVCSNRTIMCCCAFQLATHWTVLTNCRKHSSARIRCVSGQSLLRRNTMCQSAEALRGHYPPKIP